ncbi:MAG TPA: LacI family DNA-binding transcriptional regulator [Atribacteraceae bacterium]|nr:LacI family DNA-binding transcriptional regulator [Atribacteraceae bacterium]
MSTIKDVARQAGVSTATVSHVLNETRFVHEATRHWVLKAVQELDYRPNIVAKSLRRRKTGTVGLIFCDLVSPFFSDLFQSVETTLGKNGFDLLVTNTGYDFEKEKAACELFYSKQVDGIILVPGSDRGEHLQFLVDRNIPIVLLDKKVSHVKTDLVMVNNRRGSQILINYLVSLGHRRIGIIAGPQDTSTGKERLEGYYQALNDHEIPVDPHMVKVSDFLEKGGYQSTLELLDMSSPPSVIYCCNSPMLMGALKAFQEKNIIIPSQLGLAVFDDLPWFRFIKPPLTAVAQPSFALGESAAMLLISRMLKKHTRPKKVVLNVELKRRLSAGEQTELA